MKTHLLSSLLLLMTTPTFADTFGTGANQFTIDFVTIGNPGNPADTTGIPNPAGSVPYVYRMGKYEISRDMVEKANAEGGLGLTLDPMDSVSGGPRPAMPATGVSWNEAARFVNFLNTSQGYPAAYKFSTQPGESGYDANVNIELWQPSERGFDLANRFRNSQAHFFLPSIDEWYKAAYYDPKANGGFGGYWDYPTGSDESPTSVSAGMTAGTSVYEQSEPADINNAGGLSPYGVMALGGNAMEWQETDVDLVNDDPSPIRLSIGGGFGECLPWLSAQGGLCATRDGYNPLDYSGFRVASIPEPSDLNFDGAIDAADAGIMFGNWGGSGLGDLNIDGIVDAADAGMMFEKWTGDSATVPEPSSALLGALGTMGLLLHRRPA